MAGLPKAPVFQSGLLSKLSNSHCLTWLTESHSRITEYRLVYRKVIVSPIIKLILRYKYYSHLIQEPTGTDVQYVWTHLNLMGDDNPGPNHNMTYDIGIT